MNGWTLTHANPSLPSSSLTLFLMSFLFLYPLFFHILFFNSISCVFEHVFSPSCFKERKDAADEKLWSLFPVSGRKTQSPCHHLEAQRRALCLQLIRIDQDSAASQLLLMFKICPGWSHGVKRSRALWSWHIWKLWCWAHDPLLQACWF